MKDLKEPRYPIESPYDFIKLTNSVRKCSSLFHVDIRSLSQHIDELKNVLHASEIIFDFIGVSETKQLINKDFISNVDIEGYQMCSQPSKSTSGGVAIYRVSQKKKRNIFYKA